MYDPLALLDSQMEDKRLENKEKMELYKSLYLGTPTTKILDTIDINPEWFEEGVKAYLLLDRSAPFDCKKFCEEFDKKCRNRTNTMVVYQKNEYKDDLILYKVHDWTNLEEKHGDDFGKFLNGARVIL